MYYVMWFGVHLKLSFEFDSNYFFSKYKEIFGNKEDIVYNWIFDYITKLTIHNFKKVTGGPNLIFK